MTNPFAKYAAPQAGPEANQTEEEAKQDTDNPFAQYSKTEPVEEAGAVDVDKLPAPGESKLDLGLPPAPALKRKEQGRLSSAGGAFMHGFGSIVASLPKAVGEGAVALANKFGDDPIWGNPEKLTPEDTTSYQVGEAIDKWFNKFAVNPEYADEFWASQIPQGAGSMAGFLAGGVAGKVAKVPVLATTMGLGATATGVEGVQDYLGTLEKDAKADPEMRENALLLNGLLGTSEALPITRILDRLDGMTGGGVKRIIKEGFKGGLEELTQEVFQTVGQNAIASDILEYDPERGLFTGAVEAGEVGFTLGFALNTLAAMVGSRRAGKNGDVGADKDAIPQDKIPDPEEPLDAADVLGDVIEMPELSGMDELSQQRMDDAPSAESAEGTQDQAGITPGVGAAEPVPAEVEEETGEPAISYFDPRLKRDIYRGRLETMAEELVPGGGTTLIPDPNFVGGESDVRDEHGRPEAPLIRTPSLNPEWFQSLMEDEHYSMSVEKVQNAVIKANAGERLGVRQSRVVEAMLNNITGERTSTANMEYAREQLRVARETRAAAKLPDAPDWLLEENQYPEDSDGLTRTLLEFQAHAQGIGKEFSDQVDGLLYSDMADGDIVSQITKLFEAHYGQQSEASSQALQELEGRGQIQGTGQESIAGEPAAAGGPGAVEPGLEYAGSRALPVEEDLEDLPAPPPPPAKVDAGQETKYKVGDRVRITADTFDNIEGTVLADNGQTMEVEYTDPDIGYTESQEISINDLEPVTTKSVETGKKSVTDRRQKKKPGIKSDKRTEERRHGDKYRKSIDAMSMGERKEIIEELRHDALINQLTGLGSRMAWEEVEKKQFIAAIDADSLKYVNDTLGNKAGDELLVKIGKALKNEFGKDAYHVSGDEYWVHSDSLDDLTISLAATQQILINETATGPGGSMTGLGFSYGIAGNEEQADRDMKADKKDRTKQGLRVERGERPDGVVLKGDKKAKKPVKSTAPEHELVGVDERELSQIVEEFNDFQKSMFEEGQDVTNVFVSPKKNEVVRLQNKVKVYHKDHGWMSPKEAAALVDTWEKNALDQYNENEDARRLNGDKVVLSLFDLSGKWSLPWEQAGYQVFRFDIQDSPDVGDVNNFSTEFFGDWFGDFEGKDIYAILAACPCTDFAVSGARHFAAKDADGRTVASVNLVHQTLRTIEYFKPQIWAVENPVGRIEKLGGLPPWRLSFDPNHLGETYTKKTLIWGRFNADLPIAPVEPVEGSKMHKQYGGKSLKTKNARSVTPDGFAYGFFQANNAYDNPILDVANKFDRLDRALIQKALDAGVTPKEINYAVEDYYYMDLDDDAANGAIQKLIDVKEKTVKKKKSPGRKNTKQKALDEFLNEKNINKELIGDELNGFITYKFLEGLNKGKFAVAQIKSGSYYTVSKLFKTLEEAENSNNDLQEAEFPGTPVQTYDDGGAYAAEKQAEEDEVTAYAKEKGVFAPTQEETEALSNEYRELVEVADTVAYDDIKTDDEIMMNEISLRQFNWNRVQRKINKSLTGKKADLAGPVDEKAQAKKDAGVKAKKIQADKEQAAEDYVGMPDLFSGGQLEPDLFADKKIDEAAHEAATSPNNGKPEPTIDQKKAGNYEMGHVVIQGMDITIENPKGSVRTWTDDNGKLSKTKMNNHYGYIKKTEGADGDHVDIFVADNAEIAGTIFVIDQFIKGKFDEHKVVLGPFNEQEAVNLYNSNYQTGWRGAESVTEMDIDEFKTWLEGDTTKPVAQKKKSPGKKVAVEEQLFVIFEGNKQPVKSFKDASDKFSAVVAKAAEQGMGSRDLGENPVIVDQNDKQVAWISYNGRVWKGKEGTGYREEIDTGGKKAPGQKKFDGTSMFRHEGEFVPLKGESLIDDADWQKQWENTPKHVQMAVMDKINANAKVIADKGYVWTVPSTIAIKEGFDKEKSEISNLTALLEMTGKLWGKGKPLRLTEYLGDIEAITGVKGLADDIEVPVDQIHKWGDQRGKASKYVGRLLNDLRIQSVVLEGEDYHQKIENGSYLPLHIERHPGGDGFDRLYLTHYVQAGGDTIMDSEMVFAIKEGRLYLTETAVRGIAGEHRGRDAAFAGIFAKNLVDQGFNEIESARYVSEAAISNLRHLSHAKKKDLGRAYGYGRDVLLNALHEAGYITNPVKLTERDKARIQELSGKSGTSKTEIVAAVLAAGKQLDANALPTFDSKIDMLKSEFNHKSSYVRFMVEPKGKFDKTTMGRLDVVSRHFGGTGYKVAELYKGGKGDKGWQFEQEEGANQFFEYTTNTKSVGKDKAEPLAPKTAKRASGYGSNNKVVSQEAADKARELLRKKLGQLNAGLDPEMMQAGITLSIYHLEAGARQFGAYTKAMTEDLGDNIKPYLRMLYEAARYNPETPKDIVAEMSSTADVDSGATIINEDIDNARIPTNDYQLGQAGDSPLEGAPAGEVRTAETERETGTGRARGPGKDTRRSDEPGERSGEDAVRGSVSDGEGAISIPTAGEQSRVKAENYVITADNEIGTGGQKSKYNDNIAAIRLLKQLEENGQTATAEEQALLVRYVGWGGIPQAFDEQNNKWSKEYSELKGLLTEEEYSAARRSTQDAHYTSPKVIHGMYKAVERLGFKHGRILEPSMGIGHFFGLMPADMRGKSHMVGIELDSVTGAISKHLYPSANINAPVGFQEMELPTDYFDMAIGNPPFGSQKLYDKQHKDLSGFSIHNYFFAKSIDKLRPGGVLAMVVSNAMMDKAGGKQRQWMAERTKFLGAIRLPNNAFKQNALTEVTTDIIFLQKLGEGVSGTGPAWQEIAHIPDPNGGEAVPINEYFKANPQMMLGRMERISAQFADKPALVMDYKESELAPKLTRAISNLPENVYQVKTHTIEEEQAREIEVEDPHNVKVGGYTVGTDGRLAQRLPDVVGETKFEALPADLPATQVTRIKGMIKVRDALRVIMRSEIDGTVTDQSLKAHRASLNRIYDAYTKKHGALHSIGNSRAFKDDPDYPRLLALEWEYDAGITKARAKTEGTEQRKPSWVKADIFNQRVREPYHPVESVETAQEALLVSLSDLGVVDLGRMRGLTGMSDEQLADDLSGQIFSDPESGWVTKDEYLAGNVKRKLEVAKKAAEDDDAYATNVVALEAVQPEDVAAVDISVRPGSPWVPATDVQDFIAQLLGDGTTSKVSYQPAVGKWFISVSAGDRVKNSTEWGTSRLPASEAMQSIFSGKALTVRDRQPDGSYKVNGEETAHANAKADEIKEAFTDWIWKDQSRRDRLTRTYNDTYNTNRTRGYDGSHLELPGATPLIELHQHQKDVAWRIIQEGRGLLDHVVGAGKTFAIVASVMERRRMGLIRRPMVVVPNHLVGQWASDFVKLYPGAKVLAPGKKDFEKNNRRKLFAKMATGDWDAIVVAHSHFERIPMPQDVMVRFLNEQVAEITTAIDMVKQESGSRNSIKDMEKTKERIEAQLQAAADIEQDDTIDFAELGIDSLYVDEAHEYKNLYYTTTMSRVAGLGDTTGSKKAFDLFVKARYIQQMNDGSGVVFATGTPISNSMAEMYTMQRYMQFDELKSKGLNHFDAWANTFGMAVTDWELDATGMNYRLNTRFAKFVNVPELMTMYRSFADVITLNDLKQVMEDAGKSWPVPKIKGGKPQDIIVERSGDQAMYMDEIINRAENIPTDKSIDNMLKITNDARKMALDMRMVWGYDAGDPDGSKIHEVQQNVERIYKDWTADKGAQLVFIDLSTPKLSKTQRKAPAKSMTAEDAVADEVSMDELLAAQVDFSFYDSLRQRLIDGGMPENEIAYIHDANTDIQKEKLFEKTRRGDIRVLLGSTPKMGAGMNVQERLVALHHVDAPWRPSDLEQREGRIIRQGNKLYLRDPEGFEIELLRYATEQTYDARMWQTLEGKARFISQLRKGEIGSREVEDIAGQAASYADLKAAATGNPLILEQVRLTAEVSRFEQLKRGHTRSLHNVQDTVARLSDYEKAAQRRKDSLAADIVIRDENTPAKPEVGKKEKFAIQIDGEIITDKAEGGKKLAVKVAETAKSKVGKFKNVGNYRGFDISIERLYSTVNLYVEARYDNYETKWGSKDKISMSGIITRLDNIIDTMHHQQKFIEEREVREGKELANAKEEINKPFKQEAELKESQQQFKYVMAEFERMKDQNYVSQSVEDVLAGKVGETVVPEGQEAKPEEVPAEPSRPAPGESANAIAFAESGITVKENPIEPAEDKAAAAALFSGRDGVIPSPSEMALSDGIVKAAPEGKGYTVSEGTKPGYKQIKFDAKPDPEILRRLKAAGYRWARGNKVWYGKSERMPDLDLGQDSPDSTSYSRQKRTKRKAAGMTARQIHDVINEFKKSFNNRLGIQFKVYENKETAFGKEYAQKYENDLIRGAYYPKSKIVALIASDLENAKDALYTLRHEIIGHHGLNLFEPATKQAILDAVSNSRKSRSLQDIWKKIDVDYATFGENKRAEEVIARIAEDKQGRLTKAWAAIVSAIRKALRAIGLIGDSITKAELQSLINSMEEGIRRGFAQRTQPASDTAQYGKEAEAPIFYSQMRTVLAEKLNATGSAKSYADSINAFVKKGMFKREELEWSGVVEWLGSLDVGKKIKKADVLDYLDANQIEIKEVSYGLSGEESPMARLEEIKTALWQDGIKLNNDYEGYPDGLVVDMPDEANSSDYISFEDTVGFPDEENGLFEESETAIPDDAMELLDRAMLDEYLGYGNIKGTDEIATLVAEAYTISKTVRLDNDLGYDGEAGETRYSKWQLPGGENYTELLLTMPVSAKGSKGWQDYRNQIEEKGFNKVEADEIRRYLLNSPVSTIDLKVIKRAREVMGRDFLDAYQTVLMSKERIVLENTYRSGHWNENNILAHVRYNERIDAEGKRVLFIEETQSDWHQAGRKEGYRRKLEPMPETLPDGMEWDIVENTTGTHVGLTEKGAGRLGAYFDYNPAYESALNDAKRESWDSYQRLLADRAVPNAPLKTSWPMLIMKRMIRHAADNGFDKVAWTTGDQQNQRYNLSTHLEEIRTFGDAKTGFDLSIIKKGARDYDEIGTDLNQKELADFIGEELAAKIVNGEYANDPLAFKSGQSTEQVIADEGLKIGGKGMVGFYDNMLPKMVNKYVKKWGGKVGETSIATLPGLVEHNPDAAYSMVHSLEITDKMRDAAMEGQPMFSRSKKPDDVEQMQKQANNDLDEGQPVDKVFRKVFQAANIDKLTGKAYDRAVHYLTEAELPQSRDDGVMSWMNGFIETARHGLIDRYGLPDDYIQREFEAEADKRQIELQAMDILKVIENRGITDVAEAQVLQAVLTGEKIPNDAWAELSAPIRDAIDQMGKEAMDLGLISAESYEKNKGSYLHRVYRGHESQQTALGKWSAKLSSTKRKQVRGDQLKGRGMNSQVTMSRLLKDSPPDWWGRKIAKGQADKHLINKEFHIFDLEQAVGQGTEDLIEGGKQRKPRIKDRVYWPADVPIPARLGAYNNKGKWIVRDMKGDKLTLWRDFSKKERENMGEILDSRYTIAKTFMLMAHDLSTGRFLKDIAGNENWATHTEPLHWENPKGSLSTYANAEWIKVPNANVAGTKVKKWGAVAGMYVRAEIWRDLNELDKMQTPSFWQTILTQWKLNKTARNPVVHMNNVMSNMIFMDMADIRWRDLKRGLHAYINKDEHYKDAMTHGAFGASYIEHEIRRDILDPILQDLMKQDKALRTGPVENWMNSREWTAKMSVLGMIADVASKKAMSIDKKMVDIYQLEDEVFRMATYMHRLERGDDKPTAARMARDQFLNYDIRAPWVNAARRSFLPFISYTYRAVPVIAKSISERPWKIAKYATLAYAMNALAYAITGDDEDEERRSMHERTQGKTWLGTPRMIRMPFSDENDNPVFLDIRRWIPAGDVFDMNQNQMPIPAWLQFGGPLMLAGEFALNKQAFTGKEIVNNKTDTAGDKAAKYAGWAWRSWMPAHPLIPGSWYFNKIGTAATGGRDVLGRDYDLPMAALSSLGVKLAPQDIQLGFQYKARAFNSVKKELQWQARQLQQDKHRGLIDADEYEKQMQRIQKKMENLQKNAAEVFGKE